MREIDLQNWPRRQHFEFFRTFDHPHFNLCANVEMTAFYPAVKQRSVSFTIAFVYVITRAANDIPEFRYRIRGDKVVEHEFVNASTTILTDDDLFSFCPFEYCEDFAQFAQAAAQMIAQVKYHPTLEDEPGQDNVLFMTSIPWVSFTGVIHPLNLQSPDSIPRLAWGKYFKEGDKLKIPLSVHAHHALVDGVHVGRFYEAVQLYLDQPELYLG
jgi:chloramphenicol O-acetyltransferase type A